MKSRRKEKKKSPIFEKWGLVLLRSTFPTIIGIFLGWYLANVYYQPELLWYTRPYLKTSNASVGNMYVWNQGRSTDKNISIVFDAVLEDSNIKIVDLTSQYEIHHNDNKTIIVLNELKPNEDANITFTDSPQKNGIRIDAIYSEGNHIEEVPITIRPNRGQHPWVWMILIVCGSLMLGGWLGSFFTRRKINHQIPYH